MENTETQLIERCQQGQLEQFGGLYDLYVKKIYNFIYYKTHHRQTAEDLTSQTFLKALKSIGSFNLHVGTFQAWLYRIARNTVIDHYRTQHADRPIEDIWDLGTNEDLPRDLDAKQLLASVQTTIQKLPSEQRDIIMLRVWGDLSYKEIAAIVGKSENSCKMMFSRTIAKLRNEHALGALLLFILSHVR